MTTIFFGTRLVPGAAGIGQQQQQPETEEQRQWRRARGPFEAFGAESFSEWKRGGDLMDSEDRANLDLKAKIRRQQGDDDDDDLGNYSLGLIPGNLHRELLVAHHVTNQNAGTCLLTALSRKMQRPLTYYNNIQQQKLTWKGKTRDAGVGYRAQEVVDAEDDSMVSRWTAKMQNISEEYEEDMGSRMRGKRGLSFEVVEAEGPLQPAARNIHHSKKQSSSISTKSIAKDMFHRPPISLVPGSSARNDPYKLLRLREKYAFRSDTTLSHLTHAHHNVASSSSASSPFIETNEFIKKNANRFVGASIDDTTTTHLPVSDQNKDNIEFSRTLSSWNPPQMLRARFGFSEPLTVKKASTTLQQPSFAIGLHNRALSLMSELQSIYGTGNGLDLTSRMTHEGEEEGEEEQPTLAVYSPPPSGVVTSSSSRVASDSESSSSSSHHKHSRKKSGHRRHHRHHHHHHKKRKKE